MFFFSTIFTKIISKKIKMKTFSKEILGGVGRVPTPNFFAKFKGGGQGAHPPLFLFELCGGWS